MGNSSHQPHPVAAVRLIITNPQGEVLFLRRAPGEFGGGGWCLPGGKVDYGETVEEAARKELLEETALEVRDLQFLFFQDSPAREPGGMHCINFYFRCEATGALSLNFESDAWAWISERDLSAFDIVFQNDEGVRRYWRGDS